MKNIKRVVIQYRVKQSVLEDNDRVMTSIFAVARLDNTWKNCRKYKTLKDAEKALEVLNKKDGIFEYKIDEDTIPD